MAGAWHGALSIPARSQAKSAAVRAGSRRGQPDRENRPPARIANRQWPRADGGRLARPPLDSREIAGEIRGGARKLAPRPAGRAGEAIVDQRGAKSLRRALRQIGERG